MPDPTGPIMPPDAFEKADAKGTDFYADMSDEERAEEGLPPREPAKAEGAVETPPSDEPPEEEEEDEGPVAQDDATLNLFEEIAGLREILETKLGKTEPAATKQDEDALLADAREHDDPVVRAMAERLKKAEDRLGAREIEAQGERFERELVKAQREFRDLQHGYLVDGKPMTLAQANAVENYMTDNPEIGVRISAEDAAFMLFKDSLSKAAPAGAARVAGARAPVATIIDEGSSGGAPDGNGAFKPRPNETVESAVREGGRRLFGVKG